MLMAHFPSAVYAGFLLLSPDIPAGSPTFLVPSPASNAARLLVEPKAGSFARMANPQNYANNLVLQQLYQQRSLQDARLEQCQEKQEDFEQCFFYGTGGIDRMDGMGLMGQGSLVGSRYPSNGGLKSSTTSLGESSSRSSNADSLTGSSRKTKTSVPTW